MDLILSKCFDNSIWLPQTRGVSVLCKLALRDASEELSSVLSHLCCVLPLHQAVKQALVVYSLRHHALHSKIPSCR